jgi:hypothetical protein
VDIWYDCRLVVIGEKEQLTAFGEEITSDRVAGFAGCLRAFFPEPRFTEILCLSKSRLPDGSSTYRFRAETKLLPGNPWRWSVVPPPWLKEARGRKWDIRPARFVTWQPWTRHETKFLRSLPDTGIFTYDFISYWEPPVSGLYQLSSEFRSLKFRTCYYEPCMQIRGRAQFRNGKVLGMEHGLCPFRNCPAYDGD